jgi:chemotaxis protein MotB
MSDASQVFNQLRSKQNVEADPDQEGWLVSYADLITLLFIFFALMLSISVVSKNKLELLSHEFNQKSSSSLSELKAHLDKEIQKENLQTAISTGMTDEGLQVQFNERVLFALGEAALSPEGIKALDKLTTVLKSVESQFSLAVEGHTDNRPIHTAAFPSNWELSSTRAVNVLHFLASRGISEKKMMVRAYADTRPIVLPSNTPNSNPTDVSALNRRVTLLVF